MTEPESTSARLAADYAPYVDMAGVAALKASHLEAISDIEADTRLSDEGKKIELAKAYEANQAAMDGYRAKFEAETDKASVTAGKRLFGPAATDPASLLSHRDALDRAEKITTEDDARAQIDRARYSGDESMVRALTMQAHRKGWDSVLGEVEKFSPGTGAKLDAYRAIPGRNKLSVKSMFSVSVPNQFRSGLDGATNTASLRMWASKG
ncbi:MULTISPECIES: hypothetical protein [unclassified Rhodococcus (in: high G+C Gram-positive bacteria)]|uniref:hypothetical protein n=1 Tax=unclassified Rhodococcus (in: high G+C Gram-positive bacteria) TaxID=192944 RepID=UPI0029542BD9|nr:hypothetical protein [Rhodococcus sp. IEGM 1343]MDV8058421.1 hypothetical protein [Rhodococcus sp. IEGM 1343]